MRRMALAAVVGIVTSLLVACADGSGQEGDCNAKIAFDGATFRPVNDLQTPRRGERLGNADYLDCDGTVVAELGKANVFEVAGEEPATVIIVPSDGSDVVYLNSAQRYRDRPKLLKDSVKFQACKQPARFTATLQYIDPEDVPNMDEFASAVPPYTAVVSTSQGRGLPFDRWSEMTLEIEVTDATTPAPTPALLTEANDRDAELVIRTQCSGGAFEATSIDIAQQG